MNATPATSARSFSLRTGSTSHQLSASASASPTPIDQTNHTIGAITIGEHNYQLFTDNGHQRAPEAYAKANGVIYEAVVVPSSMPGSGHHSITSAPPVPWLHARLWTNFQICLTTRLCKARRASPSALLTLRRSASCIIRAFTWHPHMNQWAVALRDDSIALYNIRLGSDQVASGQFDTLTLSNQYMTGIRAMMWNPVGGTQLAVACDHGVALWSFVPPVAGGSHIGAVRPSQTRQAWMTWLRRDGHQPVSDLAYSPCGRWLATCSSSSHNVLIWSVGEAVISQGATPIGGFGGTVSLLRWSPCGTRLLAACPGGNFRVWNTRSWTSTLWETKEAIQGAVWSSDSNMLLLSSCNSSLITTLNFDKSSSSLNTRVTLDVSPIQDDVGNIVAGGVVSQLVWSPTSQRLAVSFLPGTPGCDLVALFATTPGLVLKFQVIGYIRGPASLEAIHTANAANAASLNGSGDDSLFSSSLSSSMDDANNSSMRTPAIHRRVIAPLASHHRSAGVGNVSNNSGPGRSPFVPYGAASPIVRDPYRHRSPLSSSTANALSGLTSPSSSSSSSSSSLSSTDSKTSKVASPNMPVDMQFQPNFVDGALLTICWYEGQVTSIPMYFALSRSLSSQSTLSTAPSMANGIHDRSAFQF